MRADGSWWFPGGRLFRLLVLGGLVLVADARGQSNDSVLVKGRHGDTATKPLPPRPRPPTPEGSAPKKLSVNTWESATEFEGSPRRNPRRKRTRTVPRVLEWRLLRRDRFSPSGIEINPFAVLSLGDQIRIGLKSNHSGYWYVIGMSEDREGNPTGPPRLLFPLSGVNGGRNYVGRDEEVFVPFACEDSTPSADCWMHVAPPAGRELFLAIFSRDLPFGLTKGGVRPDGVVPFEIFDRLRRDAIATGKEEPFGTYRFRVVTTTTKSDLAALIVLSTTDD